MWANKWSRARLFGLEEATFFCTFELFSQGLPLPSHAGNKHRDKPLQCGSRPSPKATREKQKDKVKPKEGAASNRQGPRAAGRYWERQRWSEELGEDQRRRDGKAEEEEKKELPGKGNIGTFQTRITGHRGLGRSSHLCPISGVFRK